MEQMDIASFIMPMYELMKINSLFLFLSEKIKFIITQVSVGTVPA